MTQEQLAAAVGISAPAVSQLETGKQGFTDSTLFAFANALGCAPADLLTDDSPPDGNSSVDATPFVPESFRRFAPDIDLSVTGYARCSTMGHLEGGQDLPDLPMPVGLREVDPDSFYVIAKGASMVPGGINDGDYCLVSPNTPFGEGLRVWLKDRQKRACIKRLLVRGDKSYTLRSWLDEDGKPQKPYTDEWMIGNIVGKGVVLAVYRGKPDAKNPPSLIADPRGPPSRAIRRAVRVSRETKLFGLMIGQVVALHAQTGHFITAAQAMERVLPDYAKSVGDQGDIELLAFLTEWILKEAKGAGATVKPGEAVKLASAIMGALSAPEGAPAVTAGLGPATGRIAT